MVEKAEADSTTTVGMNELVGLLTEAVRKKIPLSSNADEAKTLNKMYQDLKMQIRIESTKREMLGLLLDSAFYVFGGYVIYKFIRSGCMGIEPAAINQLQTIADLVQEIHESVKEKTKSSKKRSCISGIVNVLLLLLRPAINHIRSGEIQIIPYSFHDDLKCIYYRHFQFQVSIVNGEAMNDYHIGNAPKPAEIAQNMRELRDNLAPLREQQERLEYRIRCFQGIMACMPYMLPCILIAMALRANPWWACMSLAGIPSKKILDEVIDVLDDAACNKGHYRGKARGEEGKCLNYRARTMKGVGHKNVGFTLEV
uniref:Uncharacterized protein n=1 Tax=Pristionchus pacificus TaxID=54126 RepID=A0A8R1U3L8_PRIPA